MTRFRFGKGPSNNEHPNNPQQRDYDKINLARPAAPPRGYDRHPPNNPPYNYPNQRDYDQVNFSRNTPPQFDEADYDNEDFYEPQDPQNFDPRYMKRQQQPDSYHQQRPQQSASFGAPPPPQYFQPSQGGTARPYTRQMMPTTQRSQNFRDWQDDNDDYYESSRDPEQWSDRPSPMRFIIAISGLVLIAAISWFAYRWASSTSSEPALISPEQGPFKVRPEHPGGMVIPHQDKLIYDRISSNSPQTVERLLPPPDQAVASPQQQQQIPQQQMVPAEEGYTNQQGASYAQPMQPPAQNPQQLQQPKVESLPPSHAPQAAPYPASATPQPSVPSANNTLQKQPIVPTAQNGNIQAAITVPTPTQKTPTTAEEGAIAEKKEAQAADEPAQDELKKILSDTVEENKPKEAQVSAPATSSKPLQGYFAQLATLPNEHNAQKEWKRLKDRYSKELKGVKWHIRPFNMVSGKKYRILIGSFKSKIIAQSKCQQLGVVCRVIQLP